MDQPELEQLPRDRKWGPDFLPAMLSWLSELQWLPQDDSLLEAHRQVSFLELALDFEFCKHLVKCIWCLAGNIRGRGSWSVNDAIILWRFYAHVRVQCPICKRGGLHSLCAWGLHQSTVSVCEYVLFGYYTKFFDFYVRWLGLATSPPAPGPQILTGTGCDFSMTSSCG